MIVLERGQRFGRLVVVDPEVRRNNHRAAVVRCDCGGERTVTLTNLTTGNTRSCGCWRADRMSVIGRAEERRLRFTTHGMCGHPLFNTWRAMLRRCEDPQNRNFRNYGGRGITVCPEWHDPAAFIGWVEANLGPRPEGMTLDRIDNDGDYEPGNVRWATWQQQHANKRGS